VVEGARLESVYRGDSIVGSNPTVSAICLFAPSFLKLANERAAPWHQSRQAFVFDGLHAAQDPSYGIKSEAHRAIGHAIGKKNIGSDADAAATVNHIGNIAFAVFVCCGK
jgi:hypothetical protein